MENAPVHSPPKRKLSRLKRAQGHGPTQSRPRPLEPADSRLNSPSGENAAEASCPRQERCSKSSQQGNPAGELEQREPDTASTGSDSRQSPKQDSTAGLGKKNSSSSGLPVDGKSQGSQEGSESNSEASSGDEGKGGTTSEKSGAKEAESSSASDSDSEEGAGSAQKPSREHWDEEDELEDYLRRNIAAMEAAEAEAKSDTGAGEGSHGSEGSEAGSGVESGSEAEDSQPGSPTLLAGPELQRKLREQAHRECIGRAAPPEIKPMDGVLAKIRAIADAAASRAAQTARTDLQPSSAQKPQPAAGLPDEDNDDDIVIESDDDLALDIDAAGVAANMPSMPLRLAIGSETQQDAPFFEEKRRQAIQITGDQAQRPESASIKLDGKDSAEGLEGTNPAMGLIQEHPAQAAEESELEEEEEEEASYQGSSSESEEEEEEEGDPEEARRLALEEARAMLRDEKGRSKDQYFEDEAEMSEDEGHSDDSHSGSDDEEDHAELLEGLIGHEKEKRGDERLRAAAHARWLAEQDEVDVQRLMDGMKNGFRKPKRPGFFLDTDGDLADSRKRRAAFDAEQDGSEGSEQEASDESESDSEEEDKEAKAFTQLDPGDVSDDEARETLNRYQQQKLLEASQMDEPAALDLLDDDSQALLSKIEKPAARRYEAGQKLSAKTVLDIEEDRVVSTTASFLGRAAHVSASVRTNSQNNTRSYIFGCDNSNSAQIVEGEDANENGARSRGPTSFAGVKRAAAAFGQLQSGQLLSKLNPSSASGMQDSKPRDSKVDFSSILAQPSVSKAKATRLR